MVGTSDEPMLFSPYLSTTRGMVITVLYRLDGSPDISGLDIPFDDVAENTWYTDAVKWGAQYDIILGYGNGNYGPQDYVTREQLAAIINRYELFSDKIPPNILADSEYSDQDVIRDYAKTPVNELTMQGLIQGRPGNLFAPRAHATRAELAAVLHRFLLALEQ